MIISYHCVATLCSRKDDARVYASVEHGERLQNKSAEALIID